MHAALPYLCPSNYPTLATPLDPGAKHACISSYQESITQQREKRAEQDLQVKYSS